MAGGLPGRAGTLSPGHTCIQASNDTSAALLSASILASLVTLVLSRNIVPACATCHADAPPAKC